MSEHFNYQSSEWIAVFNAAKAEIESCYRGLANNECTEVTAQQLRGKIMALQTVIKRDAQRMKNFSINPF